MHREELKRALLERDFDQAHLLIKDWGTGVMSALKAASTQEERRNIFEQARSCLEKNICITRIVRAQIASELEANSGSYLYRDTDLEQPHWQVKA